MYELFVEGDSLPDAYHLALSALHNNHDETPCPDYNTRQKEASVTFSARYPLQEPMISKLFIGDPRSLEQYRQEILDGILDFEVERGNWDYTYHSRMQDQIPFILDELQRNPDSRRAVISIRNDSDRLSDSPACLQFVQYFIRGKLLHCKVLFRSNDAAKAAFMNAFALIMLQKRFADVLGLDIGSYTHRANSFHVYERDYSLFDAYVRRINEGGQHAFFYKDDWHDQMIDAQPQIANMVEQLKSRPMPNSVTYI